MADYELHSDFDSDGRITASTREYSKRKSRPGAIILANLDADDRLLPRHVSEPRPVILDYQRRTRSASDDELCRIRIEPHIAGPGSICQYYLKVMGWYADYVRIFDESGQPIGPDPRLTLANQYPVALGTRRKEFALEVRTLPGSPLSYPRKAYLRGEDELIVQLQCVDTSGKFVEVDIGYFTIAPLLFIANTAPARRVYICKSPPSTSAEKKGFDYPQNRPTIADMERVCKKIKNLDFVTVPANVAVGDTWIQDQHQIGYCHGPAGWSYVVLHLPRMRANMIHSWAAPNLANFVFSHFPSRNCGLFAEFLERDIHVDDMAGRRHTLAFSESYLVHMTLSLAYSLRRAILDAIVIYGGQLPQSITGKYSFSQSRLELEESKLMKALESAMTEYLRKKKKTLSKGEYTTLSDMLEKEKKSLNERLQDIKKLLPVPANKRWIGLRIKLPSSSGKGRQLHIDLAYREINELGKRLRQMHHAANYGGNLEVSPPFKNAPFGKIVVGNKRDKKTKEETMDPDLLRFLKKQGHQPIVEIDIEWLGVAHVDEILTFVPDKHGTPYYSILRASPGIGLKILQAAYKLYSDGLSGYPKGIPFKHIPYMLQTNARKTNQGKHPVTHMLRGKRWWHHHPEEPYMFMEPPLIYRAMAGTAPLIIPYYPGKQDALGPDRFYDAAISIPEFLYYESGQNSHIEREYMSNILKEVIKSLPGIKVLDIPVLFDARSDGALAFIPNMINMQVINNHAFIPRPYGPRMKPSDSIKVLTPLVGKQHAGRVNHRFIRAHKLNQVNHWIELIGPDEKDAGYITAEGLAMQFEDGFPNQKREDIIAKIWLANTSIFNRAGDLKNKKPGWYQVLIPEGFDKKDPGTVDLFELYTEVILSSLKLKVHWVDTWYYHVRHGGLHCGTNVIRRPVLRKQKPWWQHKVKVIWPPIHKHSKQ